MASGRPLEWTASPLERASPLKPTDDSLKTAGEGANERGGGHRASERASQRARRNPLERTSSRTEAREQEWAIRSGSPGGEGTSERADIPLERRPVF